MVYLVLGLIAVIVSVMVLGKKLKGDHARLQYNLQASPTKEKEPEQDKRPRPQVFIDEDFRSAYEKRLRGSRWLGQRRLPRRQIMG